MPRDFVSEQMLAVEDFEVIEIAAESSVEGILSDLVRSVRVLVSEHAKLFEMKAHERALCHHLAVLLAANLRGDRSVFDVDCEFGRMKVGDADDAAVFMNKWMASSTDCPDRPEDGGDVFPDVIVHKRGMSSNLLVIEAKRVSTSLASVGCDLAKLRTFHEDPFTYAECVMLFFDVREGVPSNSRVRLFRRHDD